jgi:hypothetical protein
MKMRYLRWRSNRMDMMEPRVDGIAIVDFISDTRALDHAVGWCDASPTPSKLCKVF